MSRRRDTRRTEPPRHEVPIPPREEILRALEKAAAPLAFDDVADALQVPGDAARDGLVRR